MACSSSHSLNVFVWFRVSCLQTFGIRNLRQAVFKGFAVLVHVQFHGSLLLRHSVHNLSFPTFGNYSHSHTPPPPNEPESLSSPFHPSAVRVKRTPAGCSCPWCLFEGVWMETSGAPAPDPVWVPPAELSPASPRPSAAGPFCFCFSAPRAPLAAPASSARPSTTWICQGRKGKRALVVSFFFRDTTNKKWPPQPGGIQQR